MLLLTKGAVAFVFGCGVVVGVASAMYVDNLRGALDGRPTFYQRADGSYLWDEKQ
jgi:hypothetical protein